MHVVWRSLCHWVQNVISNSPKDLISQDLHIATSFNKVAHTDCMVEGIRVVILK